MTDKELRRKRMPRSSTPRNAEKEAKRLAEVDRRWNIESADMDLRDALMAGGELLATCAGDPLLPVGLEQAAQRIQSARQALTALQTEPKP